MRQAAFFDFIKKTKLPFFFTWPLNIGYVFILAILINQGIEASNSFSLIGPVIITMGFLGLKFFLYGTAFKTYSACTRTIKELNGQFYQTYENIGIYIKGFDFLEQKNFFPSGINKTIYLFDSADLVLTNQSMILMGKNTEFGGVSYAYPVEIVSEIGLTSLPKARIISWEQNENRIKIQIEDYHYTKPIKIELKDRNEEIKLWLTAVWQKAG